MKESWSKIKEWWSNLASREKKAVILGTFFLGVFIVYQFIWTPYVNHVAAIRMRIVKQQQTLEWMQQADKEVRKINSDAGKNKNKITSPVILLGLLQKQINQDGLEQSLNQLKQASNDTIEMHFQKVEFNKLIRLLTAILKEGNVSINQMTAMSINTPGMVNADVILKLA